MKRIKVVSALIEKENRFLIGLRSTGKYIGFWEFPGGKVEENESIENALIREILEEFSIDVSIRRFLFRIEHDYDDFFLSMDCFWCQVDDLSELKLNDHSQIDWFDPLNDKEYRWLPADIKVVEKLREMAQVFTSI